MWICLSRVPNSVGSCFRQHKVLKYFALVTLEDLYIQAWFSALVIFLS
jgi:hypothetical protein